MTVLVRQFGPSEAKYFNLFNRSPSGFNNVFRPKNYTKGFGKDKEKDCGAFDGISSVKIAEKVRLFSKRKLRVFTTCYYCVFPQNIRLFSLSLEHIYLHYMSSEQFHPPG